MKKSGDTGWEKQVVAPQKVIEMIEPGMSIFLGTGVGEPRTLVKHLMAAEAANLKDLELIQLVSLADAISLKALENAGVRECRLQPGIVYRRSGWRSRAGPHNRRSPFHQGSAPPLR